MLPTITWGGEQFYDMASIVSRDRYTRPGTDGVAIHHTVGQTEFPDKNANGTSLDEQIAHVKAINQYHIAQEYGGFGYNAIVFVDGTVMTIGQGAGARAHVAHQNHHLFGIALAGTFTNKEPSLGHILGTARVLAAVQRNYGVSVTKGHNDWVAPEHRPQWSTGCPGLARNTIGAMQLSRDAIIRQSKEALDAEVRRVIAAALRNNTERGDLEALAGQIKYLTGGRLC